MKQDGNNNVIVIRLSLPTILNVLHDVWQTKRLESGGPGQKQSDKREP
jgi:hypothetical protein